MRKILVLSRGGEEDCEKKVVRGFKDELTKAGFELVKENPNFVVTLGGDGTFLVAERLYPGIPKLILRDSKICRLCAGDSNTDSIEKLKNGDYRIKEFAKLELRFRNKNYHASNDIVIRNIDQRMALRFELKIGGEEISAIGDGIVCATSQGSTGYFRSITRKDFTKNAGLAFNNTTEPIEPIIFDEGQFEFTVTRGKARLSCDNNPEVFLVRPGERVVAGVSSEKAKMIALGS